MTQHARYDVIGSGYARLRREDADVRARIHAALGDASSVVNVGAGAGSYEPTDRHVIAIEPSEVMAAQRPAHLTPAVRVHSPGPCRCTTRASTPACACSRCITGTRARSGRARAAPRLPGAGRAADVRRARQQRQLAGRRLPARAGRARPAHLPPPELLSEWLGGETEIVAVPIHRDTPDWTTGAFWAHPERVLDAEARAATSGFARMSSEVDARVEQAVRADLERGRWDARHGHLRQLDEYDAGMLLIVSRPG